MHRSTLLFLWGVAAALGLSHGEGFANPHHGSSHPNPKSPSAGNKGHAHAKSTTPGNAGGKSHAKSTTPGNTGGHTKTTPPSAATPTGPQTLTFPHAAATTQHHANHTKDSSENKKTDLHKQQELHQKKLQQEDIALRAKLEQELALVARLLHEEHHRHRHHHAMKKDNTSTPAQLQNGIQQPTNGQQRPSQQQNGSTGEQDSSQPQVAQEQTTPGTDPQHGTASNAMEYAEKLLLAAIHRLEEVLSQGRVHRHHQTAEAQPLLGEDVRAIESAMSVMRTDEHPGMEATPEQRRS